MRLFLRVDMDGTRDGDTAPLACNPTTRQVLEWQVDELDDLLLLAEKLLKQGAKAVHVVRVETVQSMVMAHATPSQAVPEPAVDGPTEPTVNLETDLRYN